MKAPEKLYIGRRNYGPLIGGWKSQPFSSTEIESIEYIRKDALLELIKEESSFWDDGEMIFRALVDKLNEM